RCRSNGGLPLGGESHHGVRAITDGCPQAPARNPTNGPGKFSKGTRAAPDYHPAIEAVVQGPPSQPLLHLPPRGAIAPSLPSSLISASKRAWPSEGDSGDPECGAPPRISVPAA